VSAVTKQLFELQTKDEAGWIGIHSGSDQAELIEMGKDLEEWVTNPLRVVERSSDCYECWRCGYRAAQLTTDEALDARVRHLDLCPQR
jgi:hypothetical protein